MRALVVFESAFGNTEQVARALAAGLARADGAACDVVEVGSAGHSLVHNADLLVVGGPTHAFGMSSDRTRQDARKQGGTRESAITGIREWIADLPQGSYPVATFDTKVRSVRWLRGAAKAALTELRRRGYRPVGPPASFYVAGTDGPLLAGERERAEAWGEDIARLVAGTSTGDLGART